MRLIDADALYEKSMSIIQDKADFKSWAIANEISIAPTIEAEPVRHGKWLDCDYKKLEHGFIETYPNAGKCCSNCRTGFKKEIVEGDIFCPNCGAKMDDDKETAVT